MPTWVTFLIRRLQQKVAQLAFRANQRLCSTACRVEENAVSYTFRIRFNRALATTILTDAPEIQLLAPESGVSLALRATSGKSLQDDERWALVGEGYKSERDAREAGSRIQDILVLTLAKLRIGANFGNRAPIHGQYIKSEFTPDGLRQIQQLFKEERYLNDAPGLTVYFSDPKPKFIAYAPQMVIGPNPDHVTNTFLSGLKRGRPLTGRERVAFDLFFASFFQSSADVRFLLLVMAVEALIEPQLKSQEALAYIDDFIQQIKSSGIAEPEKSSLIGQLHDYVRHVSIGQGGKRLAEHILGDALYGDKPAPAFFSYCYGLRSDLVHGNTSPPLEEISRIGASLEDFVADLLTVPLFGQSG
jgi:hypothetical protein